MSLIEELGSRLSASSAELPLGELLTALDKLRAAAAGLAWVRQQSSSPLGVPRLSGAIEHVEHAVHALRVAQDSTAGYLAVLGLTTGGARPPERDDARPEPTDRTDARPEPQPEPTGARPAPEPTKPTGARPEPARTDGQLEPEPTGRPTEPLPDNRPESAADREPTGQQPEPRSEHQPRPQHQPEARPVHQPEAQPVHQPEAEAPDEPTAARPRPVPRSGRPPEPAKVPAPTAPPPPRTPRLPRWWPERVAFLTGGAQPEPAPGRAASRSTAADLLREVARRTAAADRDGLRRELADAPAPVGMNLAALAPDMLHKLATELLGHQPKAEDLPALTRAARGPVLELLPKLSPGIVDTLLAQVCRVPPGGTRTHTEVPHPADTAVTNGVLVGVLLHRLGRDPDSLNPGASG